MTALWHAQEYIPNPDIVVQGDTIPAIFWNAVNMRGPNVWLRQKHLGLWRSWTWNQTADAVREIAAGMISLGFEKGECAAIMANTTIHWVWADLAILSAGGVSNGIYPTDAPVQVQYLCEDSATKYLFVENDEQLDKALAVRDGLPGLRKIIVMDMEGLQKLQDTGVLSLDGLRALGRDYLKQHPSSVEDRSRAVQPQDLAILVYTSGTTGKSKGAMHLHRGLVYTMRGYSSRSSRMTTTSACVSCRCATLRSA